MSIYYSVLFSFCLIANLGVSICLLKKIRITAVKAFLLFILSTILWIASVYAIYHFAIFFNERNLFLAIKLAYVFSLFAPLSLLLFFNFFPKETLKIPKYIQLIIPTTTVFLIGLILFTPLIYQYPIIKNGVYIADKFGSLYLLYVTYFVISLLSVAILAIIKLKTLAKGIERIKLKIAAIGCWIFIFLAVATNVVLPLFNIYFLQFESISFSLVFVIPTFYSMIKYRFLDVKLTLSKSLRRVVSFLLSLIIPYFIYLIFSKKFPNQLPPPYAIPIVVGFTLLTYSKLVNFFNSHTFHKFFGTTATEYFIQVVEELRLKSVVYTTLQQFQKDIHSTFVKKLHLKFANIVLLDEENRKNYRNLIKHFESSKNTLVLKEIQFLAKEEKTKIGFLEELENLGEVIIPLYHPSRELIAFLVLGEKAFGDIYSKEEIDALEKAQTNFSLKLTGALFSSQLKREVKRKTESLKKQNSRIRELLKQQADFIAVSAHELRTPLSIALLQTEILEESFENGNEKSEEVESARIALKKLQDLVQKLFSVQKHDLNKVGLNLKKVNIVDYTKAIYESFKPIMEEKAIDFSFENTIPKNLEVEIDPLQIRQVFQNILTNASKFTPREGKVVLRSEMIGKEIQFHISDSGKGIPEDSREAVFEKFRSLHASKGKGIGLGLYLCKKIIELHKGKIWVCGGEKLEGACFCFSLPK